MAFWAAICLCQILPLLTPAAHAEKPAEQSLFTLKDVTDSHLLLIPSIHLVPPGSTLLHKNKTLTELRAQPDGKEIEPLAQADINFFEGQLRKQIGKDAKLQVKEARFDVHQDFMGKKVTDLLSLEYTITKP
jgi:hypothetical protein